MGKKCCEQLFDIWIVQKVTYIPKQTGMGRSYTVASMKAKRPNCRQATGSSRAEMCVCERERERALRQTATRKRLGLLIHKIVTAFCPPHI